MNWIALRMLTGDRSKYLGLVFGVTFATLLMTQVLYAIEPAEHAVYVGQQLDVFIDSANAVVDAGRPAEEA